MKQIIASTIVASSLFLTSHAYQAAPAPAIAANQDKLKPTEAVENWKKDITTGSVANLWNSLPEKYQGDLNKLAKGFGEKMDAQVYNEAMSTLGAAAGLLKNKKVMVLEMIKEQAGDDNAEDYAKIEQSYDSIVGLLNAITTSDAKDIDGMKKLDIGKLLRELQIHTKDLSKLASLAGDDFEEVKAAKITLVSESGDTAVVNATADDNNEDIKLVKQGGRWLPEEMVNEWPEMIAEANKGIEEVGKMTPEEKQQAAMVMGMVKNAIKSLEATKTKEEMMQNIQGLMGMMMMGQ